ncbi:4-galactosyl-N-acetylglucosaminide 3-alpha-L-fucosyltransferase FUT6-like [Melanerpes formicivorus]|uniref:4-galactosyl-N-acetylglucosaminide 3-alpha-L-fucosyltransferase FUT6-like n=1 Tax=Melanerpes formicivorus TaxID=211600 RepID=UPI0035902DF3
MPEAPGRKELVGDANDVVEEMAHGCWSAVPQQRKVEERAAERQTLRAGAEESTQGFTTAFLTGWQVSGGRSWHAQRRARRNTWNALPPLPDTTLLFLFLLLLLLSWSLSTSVFTFTTQLLTRTQAGDPSMEPVEGKKLSKKIITLPLGLILGFCFFIYLHQLKTPWLEKPILKPPPIAAPAKKSSPPPPQGTPRLTILLWQWPFGHHFDFLNCSEHYSTPDCHFTVDRSWTQKAHAVVIHHRDVCWNPQKLTQIPRLQSQRWIWFNLESPSHSPNLRAMNNLFNLTMSYRKDSDIFTPYGELQLLSEPQPFSIPTKTKLVAWVVSNWVESSRRVRYYRELKDHIKVDIYGSHHMPLPRDQLLATLAQYKFYLAFENSQHEDYITEKLWRNALSSGAVPVVLGPSRANYERFLPPDSFIHINDFATAKELAHYLQELSEDAERYQRYFQWRRWLKPNAAFNWAIDLCRACHFLHTAEGRYQVVPDLSQWFV